jgi:hypothetical protein
MKDPTDMILIDIPANSPVKSGRISMLPKEGYLLSVETNEGWEDGIEQTIHKTKAMFSKFFYSGSKWKYDD